MSDFSNEQGVEKIIAYNFNDKKLLKKALTHNGANQSLSVDDTYQRLEFLGDALLDFVVAEELFFKYPNFDEGELTKARASLVSKTTLAEISDSLKLTKYLYHDFCGGELSSKIKSDIFESVVAGIYLDSHNIGLARSFILKFLGEKINNINNNLIYDYKSMILEYCSKNKLSPLFKMDKEEGPDHDKTYFISLYIGEKLISSGMGKKKTDAEKQACEVAYKQLQTGK